MSERDPGAITDRDILSAIPLDSVQNASKRRMLSHYQTKYKLYTLEQTKYNGVCDSISTLNKEHISNGNGKLLALLDSKNRISSRINNYDKDLLELEHDKHLVALRIEYKDYVKMKIENERLLAELKESSKSKQTSSPKKYHASYQMPQTTPMEDILEIDRNHQKAVERIKATKEKQQAALDKEKKKYLLCSIFVSLVVFGIVGHIFGFYICYERDGWDIIYHKWQAVIIACLVAIPIGYTMFRKDYLRPSEKTSCDAAKQEADHKKATKHMIYAKLKNNTVRKVAGIPEGTLMKDHLPKDEQYERFISYHGKYYHKSRACANKHISYILVEHAFNIPHTHFEPCYRCAEAIDIPDWYHRYLKILSIAKYYDFEITGNAELGEFDKPKSDKYWQNFHKYNRTNY